MFLPLAQSASAFEGDVGAPSVSGVIQNVPRSMTSVRLLWALSAIAAMLPPKPVPITMAS